mmetsp:Transcript_28636/g.92935  ORF Transcript_28636/g.92935 Transcript_28636/m.92935 type:complete len:201 (-) Transcript_28636:1337-1939(-)
MLVVLSLPVPKVQLPRCGRRLGTVHSRLRLLRRSSTMCRLQLQPRRHRCTAAGASSPAPLRLAARLQLPVPAALRLATSSPRVARCLVSVPPAPVPQRTWTLRNRCCSTCASQAPTHLTSPALQRRQLRSLVHWAHRAHRWQRPGCSLQSLHRHHRPLGLAGDSSGAGPVRRRAVAGITLVAADRHHERPLLLLRLWLRL